MNHPSWYTSHPSGIEAIEVCERLSFNLGNAVKYLFRRDLKGRSVEDTMKAAWYLRREAQRLVKFEQWLPMASDDRYMISSLGRVRRGARFRKLVPTKAGYLSLVVSTPGEKHRLYYVHREVLTAFRGKPGPGCEAAHSDGNKKNNSLRNLRWTTHAENLADRIVHGTANDGERNGKSKITRKEALAIRELKGTASAESVAVRFGLSRMSVHRIWYGEAWRDRPEAPAMQRVIDAEPPASLLKTVLLMISRESGTSPESITLAAEAVEVSARQG